MAVVQRISGGIRGRIKHLLAGERRVSSAEGSAVVSVTVGGLVAECHRRWPDDEGFYEAWERLMGRSKMGTTFTSPLWQRAVSEGDPGDGRVIAFEVPPVPPPAEGTAGEGTGGTVAANSDKRIRKRDCPAGDGLRLIAVRRGPELAAILPMRLSDEGFLDNAGFAASDYLDPLVEDGADEQVWRAVLALLRKVWDGHIKAMTLHNLRQESPCRRWLATLAEAEGFQTLEKPAGCRMTIALPPTWEQYLQMLDAHQRKELKRKMKKAREQAGATLRILDTPELAAAHLERALDLMEAAQAPKRQWLREHVRPLMMKIGVELVARGRLRLLMLMLNDLPAACLIELPSPRGPLMYNCGMDPAMKSWSPGAVAFALAIGDAIDRRCEIFDLLRGPDDYKARLGAQREEMWRVSIFR